MVGREKLNSFTLLEWLGCEGSSEDEIRNKFDEVWKSKTQESGGRKPWSLRALSLTREEEEDDMKAGRRGSLERMG